MSFPERKMPLLTQIVEEKQSFLKEINSPLVPVDHSLSSATEQKVTELVLHLQPGTARPTLQKELLSS